jgi:hypothetical protein
MARSQSQKLSSSARSEVVAGSQSESGSIKLEKGKEYKIEDIKDEKLNAVLSDEKFKLDLFNYFSPDSRAESEIIENGQEGGEVEFDYSQDDLMALKIGDTFISFYPPPFIAESEQDGYDEYITRSSDGYGESNRGDPIYKSVSRYDVDELFEGASVYVWDDATPKDFVLDTDRNGNAYEPIGGYQIYREKTKSEKEAENKA